MAKPKHNNRTGASMLGSDPSQTRPPNSTAGMAANGTRPAAKGGMTRPSRAQPPITRASANGAGARPVVSSIRERSGTQRPATRQRYAAKQTWWQKQRPLLITVGTVVVLIAVFIYFANSGNATTSTGSVPTNVLSEVTGVSPAVISSVGTGSVRNPLIGLPSSTANLTSNGKPELLYVGAEYCPYCAAERWSMVIALSRFGTFQHLGTTASSSTDVYPSTNTFTFYGATYTSKYLTFDSKEIQDTTGNTLQTLSPSEQAIFAKFDAPPYTASSNAGGIPFLDFGNQYITLSSGYLPSLLHDGQNPNGTPLTYTQIASQLSNPNSAITQAVVGNANYLTAAICKMTNNAGPSSVCNSPVIQRIEAQLPKRS